MHKKRQKLRVKAEMKISKIGDGGAREIKFL